MIRLQDILRESDRKSTRREYQLRDIGGPTFYVRDAGADTWTFIDAEAFAEGLAAGGKLIAWKPPKD
jgi:hypothetical protein